MGDNSPIVVYRGSEELFALRPLGPPPPVAADAGPAALLAARHEVVPLVGRYAERDDAMGWLEVDRRRATRLMSGVGGQGKTRLAAQIMRDAAAEGWQVMTARHVLDGGLLANDAENLPSKLPTEPAGVLVVVDYADRWARTDLLELLKRPEESGKRLRIMLLARSSGFWSPLALILKQAGIAVSNGTVRPVAGDLPVRQQLFDAAVTAFADHPALGGGIEHSHIEAPVLGKDGFALTLAVQVAALVAVLRARDRATGSDGVATGKPGDADPAAMTRELLVREIDHWRKMQGRTPDPVTVSTEVMARAVLVATLTRGMPAADAAVVLGAMGLGADPQIMIDQHGWCYPPSTGDRVLEPLYPDRLGEDFIAALLPGAPVEPDDQLPLDFVSDSSAPTILTTLASEESGRSVWIPTITILVETARRWGHVAQNYLLPILRIDPHRILECGGPVVERAASIPAVAPLLPDLGDTLKAEIGAGRHLSLDFGAVVVHQELAAKYRASGDSAALADELNTLAARLASVGRSREALTAAQESVQLYRELEETNPGTYRRQLAGTLTNLGSRLGDLGQYNESVGPAEEAVEILRRMVEVNRDSYLASMLGMSLHNLANRFSTLGRRNPAVALAREAVSVRRRLVENEPSASVPDLASSLNNFSCRLAEAGLTGEALAPAEEAADRFLALADSNREAYLPDLAMSLTNLSSRLWEKGRHEDAVACGRRGVDIRRELVAVSPATYLPKLALALQNLAPRLAAVGLHRQALEAAEEAVQIWRPLAADNPQAHEEGLAASLNTLATALATDGRSHDGLSTAQEAIDFSRAAAEKNPAAMTPSLALALITHAQLLALVDRRKALSTAQEAAEVYRVLALTEPALFSTHLTTALQLVAELQDPSN